MKTIKAKDIPGNFKVAVITSRFNEPVTQKLNEGALERLEELEFSKDQITNVWVPGAVELPVVAKRFAQKGDVKAVICLGAVIRGETTHYDYVCDQASQGWPQRPRCCRCCV
jgi:6,7-dimethyl-8-ribityllumazine synthase